MTKLTLFQLSELKQNFDFCEKKYICCGNKQARKQWSCKWRKASKEYFAARKILLGF